MPAVARTPQCDYYTRAANDDCINGGPWTRTKCTYDDQLEEVHVDSCQGNGTPVRDSFGNIISCIYPGYVEPELDSIQAPQVNFGAPGPGAPARVKLPCLSPRFANFLAGQVPAATPIANQYDVPLAFLLSLSAWESGYGTGKPPSTYNAMYSEQFNPFGATPGGDSTRGLTYSSFGAAWQRWGKRWGGSVQGVSNIQTFISNLQKAGYNTGIAPGGDPNWAPGIASVFPSVQSRLGQYLNGTPTCK